MMIEQTSLSLMCLAFLFCAPFVQMLPAPGLLKTFIFPYEKSTLFLMVFLVQNVVQDFVLSRQYKFVCREDIMYAYRFDGPARRMRLQELFAPQWTLMQLLRTGWFFHYMQVGNFAKK